jgi:type IV fimbrial biogenesis protein FimT
MKQYKHFKGFTLIELMVTLAVAAIIMTVAVPSFNNLIRNNRLTVQNNELVSTLLVARSEAVKRSTTVTVCASSDQATCDTSNWESGWIVFADFNADRVVDAGGGTCAVGEDCILFTGNAFNGGNTLRSSLFTNSGFVQYSAQGTIDSPGTFTVCDSRGTSSAKAANVNARSNVTCPS